MDAINIRRLLVGLIVGLVAAALWWQVVVISETAMPAGVTVAALGGATSLFIAGGFMGVVYALLFRPQRHSLPENITTGLVVGVLSWIVLALSLLPALQASAPLWRVATAVPSFPQLIAYALLGSVSGLLYGLLYAPLGLGKEKPVEPQPTTHIVIVGGGYAGVSVGEVLDKVFWRTSHIQVTLVSRTNYLIHTPMLSEVSSSAVNPHHISPPLRNFFQRVRVLQGDVDAVDWEQKVIRLTADTRSPERTLPFDHLVITAGGVPNFFGNQAIESNCLTFKSLQDSMLLRNQLIDMFERADFEPDEAKKRRMLTFVVIGGGFAGVELIGGLNDFGRGMLAYYPHIAADELRFVLIHTREVILPELSRELGLFAQEKLAARGVEFILNKRVTGARQGAVALGDEEIESETVVWTAGNRPSPVVEKLGVELNKRGQIPVWATLQSAERPNLWAAGDCAQIPIPGETGRFYPPTAQHALRQGKLLGYNIAATLQGKPLKPFEFQALGSLAALGHQLAVAELFGYRFSGFLAWLMWRSIYLSKLPNLEKRLRVLLDWTLDIFFPPDIVQTMSFDQLERQKENET